MMHFEADDPCAMFETMSERPAELFQGLFVGGQELGNRLLMDPFSEDHPDHLDHQQEQLQERDIDSLAATLLSTQAQRIAPSQGRSIEDADEKNAFTRNLLADAALAAQQDQPQKSLQLDSPLFGTTYRDGPLVASPPTTPKVSAPSATTLPPSPPTAPTVSAPPGTALPPSPPTTPTVSAPPATTLLPSPPTTPTVSAPFETPSLATALVQPPPSTTSTVRVPPASPLFAPAPVIVLPRVVNPALANPPVVRDLESSPAASQVWRSVLQKRQVECANRFADEVVGELPVLGRLFDQLTSSSSGQLAAPCTREVVKERLSVMQIGIKQMKTAFELIPRDIPSQQCLQRLSLVSPMVTDLYEKVAKLPAAVPRPLDQHKKAQLAAAAKLADREYPSTTSIYRCLEAAKLVLPIDASATTQQAASALITSMKQMINRHQILEDWLTLYTNTTKATVVAAIKERSGGGKRQRLD